MNKRYSIVLVICLVELALALNAKAQDNQPLKLVQKIPMPGGQRHMDHISVGMDGKRLFVAANDEKQNPVEVIDLKAGKWVSRIPGQSRPQGTFYSPDFKTLF